MIVINKMEILSSTVKVAKSSSSGQAVSADDPVITRETSEISSGQDVSEDDPAITRETSEISSGQAVSEDDPAITRETSEISSGQDVSEDDPAITRETSEISSGQAVSEDDPAITRETSEISSGQDVSEDDPAITRETSEISSGQAVSEYEPVITRETSEISFGQAVSEYDQVVVDTSPTMSVSACDVWDDHQSTETDIDDSHSDATNYESLGNWHDINGNVSEVTSSSNSLTWRSTACSNDDDQGIDPTQHRMESARIAYQESDNDAYVETYPVPVPYVPRTPSQNPGHSESGTLIHDAREHKLKGEMPSDPKDERLQDILSIRHRENTKLNQMYVDREQYLPELRMRNPLASDLRVANELNEAKQGTFGVNYRKRDNRPPVKAMKLKNRIGVCGTQRDFTLSAREKPSMTHPESSHLTTNDRDFIPSVREKSSMTHKDSSRMTTNDRHFRPSVRDKSSVTHKDSSRMTTNDRHFRPSVREKSSVTHKDSSRMTTNDRDFTPLAREKSSMTHKDSSHMTTNDRDFTPLAREKSSMTHKDSSHLTTNDRDFTPIAREKSSMAHKDSSRMTTNDRHFRPSVREKSSVTHKDSSRMTRNDRHFRPSVREKSSVTHKDSSRMTTNDRHFRPSVREKSSVTHKDSSRMTTNDRHFRPSAREKSSMTHKDSNRMTTNDRDFTPIAREKSSMTHKDSSYMTRNDRHFRPSVREKSSMTHKDSNHMTTNDRDFTPLAREKSSMTHKDSSHMTRNDDRGVQKVESLRYPSDGTRLKLPDIDGNGQTEGAIDDFPGNVEFPSIHQNGGTSRSHRLSAHRRASTKPTRDDAARTDNVSGILSGKRSTRRFNNNDTGKLRCSRLRLPDVETSVSKKCIPLIRTKMATANMVAAKKTLDIDHTPINTRELPVISANTHLIRGSAVQHTSGNVARDTGGSVARDTRGSVVRDTSGNVTRDIDCSVARDTSGSVARDTSGNVARDTDGSVVRDTRGSVARYTGGNVARDSRGSVVGVSNEKTIPGSDFKRYYHHRSKADNDTHIDKKTEKDTPLSVPESETIEVANMVPSNHIGIWKFGENDLFTSVPKTCGVSTCIAHVQNKLGYTNGGVRLWNHNRGINLKKNKSLLDYPGLTKLHIIRKPQSRQPLPGYETSLPDLTYPMDKPRVRMPCGHAITPKNLYKYAWHQVKNGAIDVNCPAVKDGLTEQCGKLWEFKDVSLLACLSEDEHNLFLSKLFSNWLERNKNVYICPKCCEVLENDCIHKYVLICRFCSHSFCCKCLSRVSKYQKGCRNSECRQSIPKVRALLQNCRMRTLVGVPYCPSVRACPSCQYVIEFGEEDSCKHMTCPSNTCRAQFCFICLKIKTDKYYWPCGGAFEPCEPAPIQRI